MKDAKGHGSNPRGTASGYAGRDALGRTYSQALADHDRFPKQNPKMPNAEDYKTPSAQDHIRAIQDQHNIPTSKEVGLHTFLLNPAAMRYKD